MKLSNFFDESTVHAKRLSELHNSLDFYDKRTRKEWRDELFNGKKTKIVPWGKRSGIWRSVSVDEKIQIMGSDTKKEFQTSLPVWRSMVLQYALVMMLAAVDKTLHQATTTKKFVQLLKSGKLDELMKNFPISETYGIAMEARKRRGRGGSRVPRPANPIREAVSAKLYELSFLATNNLEKICAANGATQIFSVYATHLGHNRVEPLRNRWSSIYKKRNEIVHECNILRTKISPKKIRFTTLDASELKKDIDFVEKFGKFLASRLG